MSCKLKKNTLGPKSPLFLLYFKDCVMVTNVWFWHFLSSIYSHGDISGGRLRPSIWKVSLSLFFSSFSFSFLFFIFFFPLSLRGPSSSGAPGHCPPMPPSRYATDWITWPNRRTNYFLFFSGRRSHWTLLRGSQFMLLWVDRPGDGEK